MTTSSMTKNSHTAINIPAMQFDPNRYEEQFLAKQERVQALFAEFSAPAAELFRSPTTHYRMRAEFRIWHERGGASEADSQCFYAMFDPAEPKQPLRIDDFPIADRIISERMGRLLEIINNSPALKHKLFQIEFLASRKPELLITLIYHRQLDETWQQAAAALLDTETVGIIGRARKQRLVIGRDTISEPVTVNGRGYTMLQGENGFTQPNATINEAMLSWLDGYLRDNGDRSTEALLEMYCGNGNFTLPLARHFDRVLATEISKQSTRLALQNCAENGVDNIRFVRMSGEETAQALRQQREFRRLKDIPLDEYAFSTVLVDPPRAGLDAFTENFVQSFQTILYISCNPETLCNNLKQLSQTHRIAKFALFDQFPYTEHCECGVVLERQN